MEKFQILDRNTYGDKLGKHALSRVGYIFKGWYTKKTDGSLVDKNSTTLNENHIPYDK